MVGTLGKGDVRVYPSGRVPAECFPAALAVGRFVSQNR